MKKSEDIRIYIKHMCTIFNREIEIVIAKKLDIKIKL